METQDPSLKSDDEKLIENPPSPSPSPPSLSSMPEIPPGHESILCHMRTKTPNPWIFNMESIFNIIEESDEEPKGYKDDFDPKQCEYQKQHIPQESKKKPIQANSSGAAEYIAGATALKDLLWIEVWFNNMNHWIKQTVSIPPLMFIDSQVMVKIVINEKIECNPLKHVELREYEIISHHQAGKFILKWIIEKEIPAESLLRHC